MELWAKSIDIFNTIREHGKQSIRSLADRTGLTRGACRALLLVRQTGGCRPGGIWEHCRPCGRPKTIRQTLSDCGRVWKPCFVGFADRVPRPLPWPEHL